MKKWIRQTLSMMLCAIMVLTVVLANTSIARAASEADVPVELYSATSDSPSMAAAFLVKTGEFRKTDDGFRLALDFQTASIMGMTANLTRLDYKTGEDTYVEGIVEASRTAEGVTLPETIVINLTEDDVRAGQIGVKIYGDVAMTTGTAARIMFDLDGVELEDDEDDDEDDENSGQTVYNLANGIYETKAAIYTPDTTTSPYGDVIASVVLKAKDNAIEVTLNMQGVSSRGSVMWLAPVLTIIDSEGNQTVTDTVTDEDDSNLVLQHTFKLPENVENTNVLTGYYVPSMATGDYNPHNGFNRTLYIDLAGAEFKEALEDDNEDDEEEGLEDGTYSIDAQFLKEDSDEASMANGALESAELVVEDGNIELQLRMKSLMGVYVYKMQYEDGEALARTADAGYSLAAEAEKDRDGNIVTFGMPVVYGADLINMIATYDVSETETHNQKVRLSLDWDSVEELTDEGEGGGATPPGGGDEGLDKENLEDGIYEVPVVLWHAANDEASMGAKGLLGATDKDLTSTARIVVKDGEYTMYLYTQLMVMGTIEARLRTFQVENAEGIYEYAKTYGEVKLGESVYPTTFSFIMPHTEEFTNVKINPQVALMGNADLNARLKTDWDSLAVVEEDVDPIVPPVKEVVIPPVTVPVTDENTTTNNTGSTVKTGDNTQMILYAAAMIIALGAAYVMRKQLKGKVVK